MTTELRDELQRLADADGRKLAGYIVRVLELHVRQLQADERPAAITLHSTMLVPREPDQPDKPTPRKKR